MGLGTSGTTAISRRKVNDDGSIAILCIATGPPSKKYIERYITTPHPQTSAADAAFDTLMASAWATVPHRC